MEMTIEQAYLRIKASDDHALSIKLSFGNGVAWFDIDVDRLWLLGIGQMDKLIHYNFDDNRHTVCLLKA